MLPFMCALEAISLDLANHRPQRMRLQRALAGVGLVVTMSFHASSGEAQLGDTPASVAAIPSAGETDRDPIELDRTVVTGTRLASESQGFTTPAQTLDGKDLQWSSASTVGDLLGREPGISSSYFGPNSSRPVVRGLDGDRIRLLQSGLSTMDASTISPDHAVAMDPLVIRRVELLRGPVALLYGPMAAGGVINLIDWRIPQYPASASLSGVGESRFNSANEEWSYGATADGGAKNLAYHLDGFRRESDLLDIPGFARSSGLRLLDPQPVEAEARGKLPNSQGDGDGGAAGLSYAWNNGYLGGSFSGYNADYGTVAEEDVTIRLHQRRGDFAGEFRSLSAGIQSVKFKFGVADYRHTELEAGEPGTVFQNDGVNGRLELNHAPIARLVGVLGYEYLRNGLTASGSEAFLPSNTTEAHSAFLFEQWKHAALTWEFAARADHTAVDPEATVGFPLRPRRSFTTASGSAGFVFRPRDSWATRMTASYNERAPSAQELFADGPHIGTASYQVGDPSLRQEQSYGVEASLSREQGMITGGVTLFYLRYENFVSFLPRGADDPDSGLPIFDAHAVPAGFWGAEMLLTIHLLDEDPHHLHVDLKADYTEAERRDTDSPLPRIPPWRWGGALIYEFQHRLSGSLEIQRVEAQERTAPHELPTAGYTLLNFGVVWRVARERLMWEILLKGSNLFNQDARSHVSFLKDIAPLAGRGIQMAVSLEF